MTEAAKSGPIDLVPTDWSGELMQRRIRRRYGAERRFKYLGLGAVLLSAGFLAFLLISMLGNGLRGFTAAEVKLDVNWQQTGLAIDRAALAGPDAEAALRASDFEGAVRRAAMTASG